MSHHQPTKQTVPRQPPAGGLISQKWVEDFRKRVVTGEGIVRLGKIPFAEPKPRLERAHYVRLVIQKNALPRLEVRNGKIRISNGIKYAVHLLRQVADFAYSYDQAKN